MSTDLQTYVKWLIEDQCMRLLKMSQDEIATCIGVTRPTLAKYRKEAYAGITLRQIALIERHLQYVKAAILTSEATS